MRAPVWSRTISRGSKGGSMFTFSVDARELFAERRRQFRGWGVPDEVIEAVESRVTGVWEDGPGGWTTEWCRQAGELEAQERWLDAALTYGAARFPCLATAARVAAYERQLAAFARAIDRAPDGTVRQELVPVTYRETRLALPVHRYPSPQARARATLLLTGGVDTWKVELHRMAGIVAQALRLDAFPEPDELPAILDGFSLAGQGLLGPDRRPAPLLVVNGTDDVYVPTADSTVFEQYAE